MIKYGLMEVSPRLEKRSLESTSSRSPRRQLPLCTQTPGQQCRVAASLKCLLAPSHFYYQPQSQGHLFPKNQPFHFAKFSFTFKILPKHLHLQIVGGNALVFSYSMTSIIVYVLFVTFVLLIT